MAETYEVDSCVRGYHFYGDIWTPSVGDLLACEVEDDNSYRCHKGWGQQ